MREGAKEAAVLAVCFLLAGLVTGYFLPQLLKLPPPDHEAIDKTVAVYDKTYSRTQTLAFVESGTGQLLSVLRLEFTPQTKDYTYSFWVFKAGNDVNAVMWIWGPGDDGKTYGVEVARLAGNELEVTYPSGKATFPAGSDIGYLWFTVTVG